jgi:FixJ family two-component response regulator
LNSAATNENNAPDALPLVFIVDDDEAVRLAIGMLVESCGWRAWPCASAEEFLAMPVADEDCACLLLDLDMPGMTGADLLERLEAESRWLPTIVVTGFVDSLLAARARRPGVRAILKKPFNDQLLIGHIREVLGLGDA